MCDKNQVIDSAIYKTLEESHVVSSRCTEERSNLFPECMHIRHNRLIVVEELLRLFLFFNEHEFFYVQNWGIYSILQKVHRLYMFIIKPTLKVN